MEEEAPPIERSSHRCHQVATERGLDAAANCMPNDNSELRNHEKQAAEELGQWSEKRGSSDAAALAASREIKRGRDGLAATKKAAEERGEKW